MREFSPRLRSSVWLVAVFVLASALPLPAFAGTGQVIGGDNDVAGNVVDAGNTVRVVFDSSSVLNSCPTGVSGCFMEYRWRSKKDCALCIWSADTSWIVLPVGGPTLNHCKATGNYRFELQVRLRWNAPVTQTVSIEGKYETQTQIDVGSVISKLIPAGVFNWSNGQGWKIGNELQRNTATSAASSAYTMATSGSTYMSTVC